MNDIELKAQELKRKAWEALESKSGGNIVFQELHRLERQTPEFFEQVVKQLEADNGRWSASSALPNVEVKRDPTGKIDEISFHSIDEITGQTLPAANIEEEARPQKRESFEHSTALVWRSDHADRNWIEDFTRNYKDDGR